MTTEAVVNEATGDARRRAVTMTQVAEAAGVTVAHASRALAGAYGVSEATQERVRAAAKELGYKPWPPTRPRSTGRPPGPRGGGMNDIPMQYKATAQLRDAIRVRADRETEGSAAEWNRRAAVYALTHMPAGWEPGKDSTGSE